MLPFVCTIRSQYSPMLWNIGNTWGYGLFGMCEISKVLKLYIHTHTYIGNTFEM